MLTGALRQLFAVSEAYPDLKANTNFLQLQEELTGTEGRIAYARQYYNDAVQKLQHQDPDRAGVDHRQHVRLQRKGVLRARTRVAGHPEGAVLARLELRQREYRSPLRIDGRSARLVLPFGLAIVGSGRGRAGAGGRDCCRPPFSRASWPARP